VLSALSIAVVVIVMVAIVVSVMAMMPAMFPTDVGAVNPMTPLVVAGDPNHFPVACPVTGAMGVVRPVANRDAEALSLSGDRKKNAGPKQGDEQKFVFDHTC
jgi:hypothetical protein